MDNSPTASYGPLNDFLVAADFYSVQVGIQQPLQLFDTDNY